MRSDLTVPDRPFGIRDLPDLELPRHELRTLIDRGLVRRVTRGSFLPITLPDTTENRAASLANSLAPHHVVVDRTAAAIHGVPTYTYPELAHDIPIEVCALRGHTRSRRPEIRGRTRDLSVDDVMTIGTVRVTTPMRTACDLGCNLQRRDAFAALCGMARVHGIDAPMLLSELPRFNGRRGIVQFRDLAGLVDRRLESPREAWTLLAIADAGLPLPEPQVWIIENGVALFRLDFAYLHQRVCVEYDGFDSHRRTTEQIEADRVRRRWLREHGWTIIVIRIGDFTGDAELRWLRKLREALFPVPNNRRW